MNTLTISNDVYLKKKQGIAALNLTRIMETDIVDVILTHLSTASMTYPQYHHLLNSHINEMMQEVIKKKR
jgi:hypothetical protein